jgi:lipopolysaccharide transport system permease protein
VITLSKVRQHLSLVVQLAARDINQTYRNSYLGIFWTILGPLLMLGIYFFVFGLIFKGRFGASETQSRTDYALTLFCSLSVFGFFGNCVNNATALFVGRPNYVTQFVFPLGLLPFVLLLTEAFNLTVSMTLVLAFHLVTHGLPSPQALLIPFHLIPLALCALGMTFLVATLTVFIRDVAKVMPHIIMGLSFASAVFFPISMAPASVSFLLRYNPIAICVENVRGLLILGDRPDMEGFFFSLMAGFVLTGVGYALFRRARPLFADFM